MTHRECRASRSFSAHLLIILCFSLLAAACSSTSTFLTKGEEYLQKRKFHDALMQFRAAVESDKSSAPAHWGMARSYESLGQFSETVEELRQTVELDGTNLEAKSKLGNYFLLVQPPMISEAEKLKHEILTADAKFIEGHLLGASIMAAQGKPDADVVRQVNDAIALDPQRIASYISLQRLYMTRENAADAETAIKRGIEAVPNAVAGYAEYGRFLMYSGRDPEAESQFRKAVEIGGASIEAHEAIAEFYATTAQMAKAEAAHLQLVQLQENSPESRLVLADFYAKADRKDEAINTLNLVIADSPEYVLARYRVGGLYLERKDTARVNEQLESLFAINDDDLEALLLRARLSLQENNPEKAVKDLEDVLKQTPSGREPLFLISQARLSLGQVDQAKAFMGDLERYHPDYLKVGLLKIQAAFTSGDAEAALKLSNELIERANAVVPNAGIDPQMVQDLRVRGLSSRGIAHLELGKLAEAQADLKEVVRLSPRSASALVNLAKVSVAENDLAAALELYNRALANDGQNFDAITGLVGASIKTNQTAAARSKLADLIAVNVGAIPALRYLNSTIFSAEKNFGAAEQELLTAIELDSGYLPAYSALASLMIAQNRPDEAAAQYQKVIERRPTAEVYTMLGILEDGRGNSGEAEKAYRHALDLVPGSPIAANNLAWLIADNGGNLDEALQLARGAVSKNESVAGYRDTLGYVYLKKGLSSSAVEQLKKAVALDDADASRTRTAPNAGYRVRLGMALAKSGDRSSARREVEASLRNSEMLSQREVTEAKSVLALL